MNLKWLILISALILTGICASCKKDDKKTEDFPFSIANFGDVTLMAGSFKSVSYEIKLISGDTQMINLSVSGLPYGTSVNFVPSNANTTFNTKATFFVSEFLKPGNYPFSLIAKTADGKEKVLNATLYVIENCGIGVIGDYSVIETNAVSKKTYTSNVVGLSEMYLVKFQVNNLNDISVSANIFFDCASKTISIPSQNYNNGVETYNITGSGTIGSKSFVLNYTLTSASTSSSYTSTFTKTFPL